MRDSKNRTGSELYPLAEFPDEVIYEISKWLVYYFAVGKSNISGEDWGDIFSKAIDGDHLTSPVGLADVILEGQAWSVKSVQHNKPHACKSLRIISGRNSPVFSYGVENVHQNVPETGRLILGIWNERVNIALDTFDSLRTCILIRNVNTLEFALFEVPTNKYVPADYAWKVNKNNNFEGYDKVTGRHKFTWQPHGSQFTVKYDVPASAVRFKLKRPPVLSFEKTMEQIGFSEDWVTIN